MHHASRVGGGGLAEVCVCEGSQSGMEAARGKGLGPGRHQCDSFIAAYALLCVRTQRGPKYFSRGSYYTPTRNAFRLSPALAARRVYPLICVGLATVRCLPRLAKGLKLRGGSDYFAWTHLFQHGRHFLVSSHCDSVSIRVFV